MLHLSTKVSPRGCYHLSLRRGQTLGEQVSIAEQYVQQMDAEWGLGDIWNSGAAVRERKVKDQCQRLRQASVILGGAQTGELQERAKAADLAQQLYDLSEELAGAWEALSSLKSPSLELLQVALSPKQKEVLLRCPLELQSAIIQHVSLGVASSRVESAEDFVSVLAALRVGPASDKLGVSFLHGAHRPPVRSPAEQELLLACKMCQGNALQVLVERLLRQSTQMFQNVLTLAADILPQEHALPEEKSAALLELREGWFYQNFVDLSACLVFGDYCTLYVGDTCEGIPIDKRKKGF